MTRSGVGPRLLLLQIGESVMRDPAARRRGRPHLHRAHPARLGERDLRQRLEPHVLPLGRHRVGLRLDHEIGLAELLGKLPAIILRPLLRGRHVLRIAQRRARVHPLRDGRICSSVSDMSFWNC